ncbi:MAG TPA: hypothetical protein VH740_15080 [Vicinamibacterales bacterium]|jgi:hypothetical protein
MRRLLLIPTFAIALSFVPSAASAVTLREIVELTKAGLSEEILLALIEIDPRVYPIDPATLRMLKESGVSERVIVAMVKSGRTPPLQAEQIPVDAVAPAPPEPQVVVVEKERPIVREVAVPVPVYIAVPVARHTRDRRDVERPKPAPPVYWGWGGKLRPDAWTPRDQPQETAGKSSGRRN